MLLKEALNNVREINTSIDAGTGTNTAANVLLCKTLKAKVFKKKILTSSDLSINIGVFSDFSDQTDVPKINKKNNEEFVYFQLNEKSSGWIISSSSYYLFSFVSYIINDLSDTQLSQFEKGKIYYPAFTNQRVSYDYFLTQEGRIQRNFNKSEYISELARLGMTHVEVNGLAFPMALETGPKGETYPMFYTYCPALDQFVYSKLNKGLYPEYYLSANLQYLKDNAQIAVNHGLIPGLLCFEPRSVPEEFFNRYPMLRGARVDHPFRSFKPRYNMTITHPAVREHYTEMMQKLMKEVPELGFINIWTNDSGAGFEHTKSLYVGRNGGAYLIREWKDDKKIARLAGENAIRFFKELRDAASEINPDFRVITRMESFYGEHDIIMDNLGDRLDIETASLIQKGWDMPYSHPKYADKKDINAGTIYQLGFDKKEKDIINILRKKGSKAHYYFVAGPHWMFEPLLGIPYPKLTHTRLKLLYDNDVKSLAQMGGAYLPEHVPYNINQEVIRVFQYEPGIEINILLEKYTIKHAGKEYSKALLQAWKLTEEAIIAFPNVSSLYSALGFTWYRLWVRPLVPDIEAIPQEERDYYEDFMCTTPHNPNNVDLSRDVLFRLIDPKNCINDVERIDKFVLPVLNKAVKVLESNLSGSIKTLGEKNIISDQLVRIRALRCWLITQRNVAAWVTGVYGYIEAKTNSDKEKYKTWVKSLILMELDNTEELLKLFDEGIEFMAITDQGETPLIYGENITGNLKKRIELMKKHINDNPRIDMNYIEKKSAELIK